MALAVHRVGVHPLAEVVVAAELEAGHGEDREAVIAPLLHLEVEDREAPEAEELGAAWLQPGEHLALGHRQVAQLRQQLRVPGPRAEDQPPCGVAATRRAHGHAVAGRLPPHHRLARPQVRAARERGQRVGHHAALGEQEPAVGLVDGQRILCQPIPGKALRELRPGALIANYHVEADA